jgi:hypothetical protein
MFLSLLLFLTILFAFASGVALGYCAIFAILHFFEPARLQAKPASGALAPSVSGD